MCYCLNMHKCPRCKRLLPATEFSKRPGGKPSSYCKVCQRAHSREHYEANKTRHNKSRAARGKLERKKIRAYLIELKSRPCADCGETHPYWAVDFDHRDPKQKEFSLGAASTLGSMKRAVAEAAKCDIVCALCHRYRTYGVRRNRAEV